LDGCQRITEPVLSPLLYKSVSRIVFQRNQAFARIANAWLKFSLFFCEGHTERSLAGLLQIF
jgi:hypothetical protein